MQANIDQLLDGTRRSPGIGQEQFEPGIFFIWCAAPENGYRNQLNIQFRVLFQQFNQA